MMVNVNTLVRNITSPCRCITHRIHTTCLQTNSINQVYFPKGRGGRSSVSGKCITLFGSSGMVGSALLANLGREGSQVIIPHRCDPYFTMFMKPMADLGQFIFLPDFDLMSDQAIEDSVRHSNIVVNCIGTWKETRNYKFQDVNIDFPRRLAQICANTGVERLIHLTGLSTDSSHKYANTATKVQGDMALRSAFPRSTILKLPSVFGYNDRFINYFAGKKVFYPIYMGHFPNEIEKQPVFLGDVVQAINNAMVHPTSAGSTYALLGPKRYYLTDLIDFFSRIQALSRPPKPLAFPNFLMYKGTRGWLEMVMSSDDVSAGLPGLSELGISGTPLEKQILFIMREARMLQLRYVEVDPKIEPPPVVTPRRRSTSSSAVL